MTPPLRRRHCLVALVLLAGTAPACAQHDDGEEPLAVQYLAERLVVAGVVYWPDPSAGSYLPGVIGVSPRMGREGEFIAMLRRFGLRIDAPAAAGSTSVAVEVPLGYESHWVRALRAQASVRAAHLRSIGAP